MARALEGTRVVDVSEGCAGGYCTRLLADLGADVVKVETPRGDSLRRLGPFPGGVSDLEHSGMFLHLNANKRGVVLDVDAVEGRTHLESLIRAADIVVDSYPADRADALALSYAAACRLNPRVVATSITPFGRSGPYAGWRSDEIVEWAMGGWMSFVGDPEKEPLIVPGQQAAMWAGQTAAIGSLAALRHARRTGLGQQVEISHFESMGQMHMVHTSRWIQEGHLVKRTGVNATPCRDGFVEFQTPFAWDTIFVLLDKAELLADPEYANPATRTRKARELSTMLKEWCATQSKVDVETNGQELRVPVLAARTIGELVDDHPQMQARDWVLTLDHPRAGRLRYPGFQYKLSATPCSVDRPAPLLGEHTDEVLREVASRRPARPGSAADIPDAQVPGPDKSRTRGWHTMKPDGSIDPDLPLADLKVVELTSYWGGPLAGRWLHTLGADIIRIEFAQRRARRRRSAEQARGSPPETSVEAPSEQDLPATATQDARRRGRERYNRGILQNKMNPGKRGIALNLGIPEGKDAFLKLVQWADVVLENNSARVMPNFGLGYDELRKVKPDIIMLSMSAFGATGPWRDYVAFGSNIEASCGLMSLTGHGPGENWKTGSFYADPVGGNIAALSIIAALQYRDRTGEGQHIDLGLNEATVAMFAEQVMDYTMNGIVREPMGNRSVRYAPQGAYRCMGEDSWVALAVRDNDEWRALCRVIAREDLLQRNDLESFEGRRSAHDEIDEALSVWARPKDHHDAARVLQAHGVPAGPLFTNREMVRDPHLFERGFFVFIEQPGLGVLPYPSWPWKLSRTPASVRRHPALYAEHNREVFEGVLGMSEAEIEALYESGATADEDFSELNPEINPD